VKGILACTLRRTLAAIVVLPALSGCAFMPGSGPTSHQIEIGEAVTDGGKTTGKDIDYIVVDLGSDVVRKLSSNRGYGLRGFAASKISLPQSKLGIGDILAVTIWEAGEGGLFSNASTKSVNLPAVTVDRNGEISIPYSGVLKVKGKTPVEVEKIIVDSLKSRAIHPQAVVNIVKNETNTIVLSGDVIKPGRYPLSLQGTRLLDVVAEAGGAKAPAQEMFVTFIRGDQRASQSLKAVIDSESENIYVRAGDQVYLSHEPQKFTVLGAVAKPGVYPFGAPQVNLLEAMAGAGGLVDEKADGTGLFLFRHEARKVVDILQPTGQRIPDGPYVPVVYRVNMRDPSAYFYAKAFQLQDKDVLFVANARGVEVAKVLTLINMGTRTVGAVLPNRMLRDW